MHRIIWKICTTHVFIPQREYCYNNRGLVSWGSTRFIPQPRKKRSVSFFFFNKNKNTYIETWFSIPDSTLINGLGRWAEATGTPTPLAVIRARPGKRWMLFKWLWETDRSQKTTIQISTDIDFVSLAQAAFRGNSIVNRSNLSGTYSLIDTYSP